MAPKPLAMLLVTKASSSRLTEAMSKPLAAALAALFARIASCRSFFFSPGSSPCVVQEGGSADPACLLFCSGESKGKSRAPLPLSCLPRRALAPPAAVLCRLDNVDGRQTPLLLLLFLFLLLVGWSGGGPSSSSSTCAGF